MACPMNRGMAALLRVERVRGDERAHDAAAGQLDLERVVALWPGALYERIRGGAGRRVVDPAPDEEALRLGHAPRLVRHAAEGQARAAHDALRVLIERRGHGDEGERIGAAVAHLEIV